MVGGGRTEFLRTAVSLGRECLASTAAQTSSENKKRGTVNPSFQTKVKYKVTMCEPELCPPM